MTDFWATITNAAYSQRRNHVFKVGVEFLDLGYYCPSPEKNFERYTQFGAVCYPHQKLRKKLEGPSNFLGRGTPRSHSGCAHSYWEF